MAFPALTEHLTLAGRCYFFLPDVHLSTVASKENVVYRDILTEDINVFLRLLREHENLLGAPGDGGKYYVLKQDGYTGTVRAFRPAVNPHTHRISFTAMEDVSEQVARIRKLKLLIDTP